MKKVMAGIAALLMGATAAHAGEDFAAAQASFLEANGKKQGWHVTPSGLQYHRVGKAHKDAKQPAPGATVKVNYEGKTIDGKVFDSSFARKEPVEFPLGQLIKGWQEGIPLMHVGETFQFAIPSDLGYGPRGAPPDIPGGAVLLFKIQLLDVKG